MRYTLSLILAMLFASFAVPAARAEAIRVGAAVSLKEAFTDIAKAYTAETGESVEFVFGSSGQIAAQIKSGAAVDAFVSAANKQVDDLTKDGLLDTTTRRVIAGNTLVLIVPAGTATSVTSFADLTKPETKRVAIGEPKTVPAGQYAQQVIESMKLSNALAGHLVYGTNVRQVLAYVERGEVTAGIVYASDAKQSGDKVKTVAIADEASHEPIVYPAAVIGKSAHGPAARKFLDYLGGEKARAVLAAAGFTPPPAAAVGK